jgi:single-strand DNA-binding protein
MAGSLNKMTIIGNLGKDPEIRVMQDGTKIASFSVATSENWRDRNTQEKRERTEWHRVVVFNPKLVEICERYLRKGSKIYLEGQLQTREWTDQQNKTCRTQEVIIRYRGEIVLLDSRSDSFSGSSGGFEEKEDGSEGYSLESIENSLSDEIPF